jgi:hypothetical protein
MQQHPTFRRDRFRRAICWLVALFPLSHAGAATVDETQLPPAATNRIDFLNDIKPILDATCLKCHGPERPKSHFRIDDRDALLKGGEVGVAVIPGQSAKSPLIHYVAGLAEDMEMPPKGKGDPLTPGQISLLRAWIDQGLPWGGDPISKTVVEIAPTLGWITVKGNEQKFREDHWTREGWNGGVDHFLLRDHRNPDKHVTVEGHALRDDYKITLSLDRSDSVFLRAGFEQYRKYFNDSGGYYAPFTPAISSPGRDLHLDLGKAWLEVGGTTPFGLSLVGGYEYHFKEGEKSLTEWGSVGSGGSERAIYPTSKEIDERLHVLRLDATYDWAGLRLEDNFRYESYDLTTERATQYPGSASRENSQRVRETDHQHNVANAFRAETQPRDWLLLSAGYLYTHADGDAGFRQTPFDATTGQPRDGLLWNGRGILLEQSAHVFNANAQFNLWEGTTLASGVQTEWSRQHTFGNVNFDEHEFGDITLTNRNPAVVRGDYDRFTATEQVTLRNTQIPFTVLYAEGRFRQEKIDQFQSEDDSLLLNTFVRDIDAIYNWRQYRAGFNVSPWTRVALSAYAQRRDRDDSFDQNVDFPGNGYPGFITERETQSDEAGARLVLRPASWIKTTLTYRILRTDYETETDSALFFGGSAPGGRVQAGEHEADVYGVNVTLTPWRRLYLFASATYQDSSTTTEHNGVTAVAAFRGHVYSALATANYVLNNQTDLKLTYDFSSADYSQNNVADGLPLGIDYQRHGVRVGLGRQFWKRFRANLEYAWFYYDEPSSGGFNDYTAHGVFGTLAMRWD